MLIYAALWLLVFGVSLIVAGRSGSGWPWDLLNGLGFLALALMLVLFLDTGRGGRLALHRLLGWSAVFLVFVHAFGLMWTHPVSIEYTTLSGPVYIGMGFVSGLLLLGLVQSAEAEHRPRFRSFARFRSVHWALGVAALLTGLYHVVGSGFYVDAFEGFALTCGCLAIAILPRLGVRPSGLRSATGQRVILISIAALVVFVCLKFL